MSCSPKNNKPPADCLNKPDGDNRANINGCNRHLGEPNTDTTAQVTANITAKPAARNNRKLH